jgi:hypothetical protein
MILLQNYYVDKNEGRQAENDKCLEMNVANEYITKIVLLVETEARPVIQSEKIQFVEVETRPTYTDFFRIANEVSSVNDVIIISNSDIYFNESIALANNIKENECYALSRWNKVGDKLVPFHHSDSQDTWIMRSPIRDVVVDFTLGVPGCDNSIAHHLCQAGYEITNPCRSIVTIHLHDGNEHNYTAQDRVPPPYLRILPI